MATWSLKRSQIAFIQDALIALALVSKIGDLRESTAVLSLLNDAALRLHAQPKSLFKSISKYCDSETEAIFLEFLNRSENDKKIEAMGYFFKIENGGSYIRTW
jgi:hypothetical protein